MESDASWAMLALALALVLGLTAWAAWLSVTEVRAVRPVPATVRPGRLALRPGPPAGEVTGDEGSGPRTGE